MYVHVSACCLVARSFHTDTIMLLGGNIGLVLPVGIVVCRELPSHIIGFIMQRVIPILFFMPFLISHSKNFLFTSIIQSHSLYPSNNLYIPTTTHMCKRAHTCTAHTCTQNIQGSEADRVPLSHQCFIATSCTQSLPWLVRPTI